MGVGVQKSCPALNEKYGPSAISIGPGKIKILLKMKPVMIFIKGTSAFPQCGFTRRLLEILERKKITFGYFNILADNDLRETLKIISNWKTYPQVYVNQELIGGLDIIIELEENGEFDDIFNKYKCK